MGDAQDRIDSSPFWEPSEPPGWPAPPDQIEVTGQWRPAPERNPAEAAGSFAQGQAPDSAAQAEATGVFAPPPSNAYAAPDPTGPFETTGAFTMPPDAFDDSQGPDGALGAGQPRPAAGPYETTGAFTRPQWDDDQGIGSFDAPSGPTSVYGEPPVPGDVRVAGSPTMVNAPIPAWEDSASTGFLGSGWSGTDDELLDPEPPRRRRGRRKPPRDTLDGAATGGRGKVALLSVAAVAVVLGGTVAGVKMMGAANDLSNCPGGKCAAVQTNQPGLLPSTSPAAPVDTESAEEPTDGATDSPSPTQTGPTQPARRTNLPQPQPTATKKTKVKQSTKPTKEPTPVETPAPDNPTEEPTTENTSDTGVFPSSTSAPMPSSTINPQSAANGGSVNVSLDVTRRGLAGYTAKVSVANTAQQDLSAATVSVPVGGKVLDVKGADWTQDGDLLIIDMANPLAAGDSIEITFDAAGRATAPETCGLVGGDCSVS